MVLKFTARVTVDISGLKNIERILKADLRQKSNGPIRKAMRQWAIDYNRFLKRRFLRYSRGGGDWRSLADSTVRKKKGNKKILRDTETLRKELFAFFGKRQLKHVVNGVSIQYGKGINHPESNLSVGRLTEVHQKGISPNLPRRPIIVSPSPQLKRKMNQTMQRALNTVVRRSRVRRFFGGR